MSWLSRTKNRLTSNTPNQFGFYVDLPSLPRLVLLLLIMLPIFLGFWYLWAQLLGFWMSKVDGIVEPEFHALKGINDSFRTVNSTVAPIVNLTTTVELKDLPNVTTTTQKIVTTDREAKTTVPTVTTTQKLSVVEQVSVMVSKIEALLSKEEADPEPLQSCDANHFRCAPSPWNNFTRILPWTRLCDGKEDCWNGADERNCTACLTSFSCPHEDGKHLKCLKADKLCDGHAECLDDSDETKYCNRNCTDDEIPCSKYLLDHLEKYQDVNVCTPKSFICAGEKICRYGYSDFECTECSGRARACMKPFATVQKCISIHDQCDGKVECDDHRDENFFHCNGKDTCPGSCSLTKDESDYRGFVKSRFNNWMSTLVGSSSNLHCNDGKWYSPLYACDGNHTQCDGLCQQCTPEGFFCSKEKRCIPKAKVCDKTSDCKDGSDEEECEERAQCGAKENRCDGYCDCWDDCRDENNCTSCKKTDDNRPRYYYSWSYSTEDRDNKNKMNNENKRWIDKLHHAFLCPTDRVCLSIQQRCDGFEDCSDGFDEQNCSCAECMMHPHRMYVCEKGQRCFRYDDVCDKNLGSKCPNATRLDEDHCNLLLAKSEAFILN